MKSHWSGSSNVKKKRETKHTCPQKLTQSSFNALASKFPVIWRTKRVDDHKNGACRRNRSYVERRTVRIVLLIMQTTLHRVPRLLSRSPRINANRSLSLNHRRQILHLVDGLIHQRPFHSKNYTYFDCSYYLSINFRNRRRNISAIRSASHESARCMLTHLHLQLFKFVLLTFIK